MLDKCRLLLLLLAALPSLARGQVAIADSVRVFEMLDSIYSVEAENASPVISTILSRQERIAHTVNIDSLIVKAMMNRGQMLEVAGVTEGAMKTYFDALKVSSRAGLHWYSARLYYNIGLLYQGLNDLEHSTSFYHNSKHELESAKRYVDTISLNYEIGFNKAAGGDIEGGMAILRQNLEAAKKAHREDDIIMGLDNICNIYGEIEQYETALKYLLEAFNYPNGIKTNYRKAVLNEHVAEIYVKLKQWSNAQRYLDTSLYYSRLIKSRDWLQEGYRLQSTIYEATGQAAKALEAHKLYSAFRDSVFSSSYANKATLLSSVHDLEKKQAEIKLLQKDNQLIAEKVKRQDFQRKVWIGGSVLAIALVAMGLLARTQRRIRKMQVSFSHALLDAQEMEKQRISRELHDSIGQNILFVKNQLARSDAPDAKMLHDTIAATIEEVRSISKDLYPNQLDKYGLAASVDALGEKVQSATGIFMSADMQAIDSLLSKEACVSVYRIIQEAINNVVKHAQARAIRITGETDNNKAIITIMDNGRGFDTAALEHKAGRSFGVLNMEERARMLGGKMTLQSSGSGTKITVIIPLQS